MTPKLCGARYVSGYKIALSFEDGTAGVVDLESQLWGEVFEPLRELAVFQDFVLDPDLQTLTWPTGADLAPEFLYEQAAGISR
ncbi:MAG: DUF2442 domain-containing protein [Halieaceae bacterium]